MVNSDRGLKVLWATDGSATSELAIPLLRRTVLPAASKLTVLTVAPHSFLSGARPDPSFLTRITPAARRRAMLDGEQTAQEQATRLDPLISVEAISRWGNPIEEILREARALPADLIVLGAKGHSNLSLLVLGSVAQGVVQHSTLPVLIARPGSEVIRRIVVGFDGTAQARKGIDFLSRLSLPQDSEVTLACVVEPFQPPPGAGSSRRVAAAEAARIDERQQRNAEKTLQTTAEQLAASGLKVQTATLTGAPGPALDQAARERGADLVVVGSRKPSPARHYLLGSTAEKLVRHSPISVLVVR